MSSWHAYPKLYNFGHAAIQDLLQDEVIVEEKVDGSQCSFGVYEGELKFRSKGVEQYPSTPSDMFYEGYQVAKGLADMGLLCEGWMYSGEYLKKPRHNTLAYARVPKQHFILFDVRTAEETYLSRKEKEDEAARLGFEVVPLLFAGRITEPDQLQSMLHGPAVLGGVDREGIVVKNYVRFTTDKKVAMAKLVTEQFKETHKKAWKKDNPRSADIIENLAAIYRHENRWKKAVQHLRDAGDLTNSLQDIGPLMKAIPADIVNECDEEIKLALFKWAWPQISRKVTAGFPQWYKNELARLQFPSE